MSEQENKKIAFYIGSLAKGGAERVITNLAEYFFSQGYQVFMVTKMMEDSEYSLSQGIERIIADITPEEETDSRIRNLHRRIRKLRTIWKEKRPDGIVSFIGKNNLMAIASSRFLRIPVYVSVRSAPKRELGGSLSVFLSFMLFSRAKGVILQTREAKSFFPQYIQKKAVVLPNSLNPLFIRPPYQGEREKTIVSVGRLDDNKNQQLLIEVFSALADQFKEWNLKFYGDGENYEKLKKIICEKKMEQRIFLMGNQPHIEELIQAASVFVLTSRVEGMPNALMEAMALGLAVISTDCPCGGPADLIENGKNGILIPVDDEEALSSSLKELLEHGDLRQQLSAEARKIVERINPDKVNRSWMEYIEGTQY